MSEEGEYLPCNQMVEGSTSPNDSSISRKNVEIEHLVTAAKSPEQNGVAERLNNVMTKKGRVMLLEANLPLAFFGKSYFTFNFSKK